MKVILASIQIADDATQDDVDTLLDELGETIALFSPGVTLNYEFSELIELEVDEDE